LQINFQLSPVFFNAILWAGPYQPALFTNIHIDVLLARVTLDRAAPLELTPAAFSQPSPVRVVATPTAHDVTTVRRLTRPATLAALRTERAYDGIDGAVVGRRVDVDELLPRGADRRNGRHGVTLAAALPRSRSRHGGDSVGAGGWLDEVCSRLVERHVVL